MQPQLGHYELRRVIGSGASGTVWEAWDQTLHRRAAIKVTRLAGKSAEERADLHARFRQEAQITAGLQHQGVVSVFGYEETRDEACLIMEFVDGETLLAMLGRGEPLSLEQIVSILGSALRTLDYCHRRGIVHRDIKPSNLMVTSNGDTKVADFGVARHETSTLTMVGTLIGTLPYMSPEQFTADHPLDGRTDIWSCGVVLYELLTGQRPFQGKSMSVMMHQVLTLTPPAPSSIARHLPSAFDAVVAQALAKNPRDRFANALAFATALQNALPRTHARTVPPHSPTPQPDMPNGTKPGSAIPSRRWLIGGGVAMLCALGAGALWRWGRASMPLAGTGTGAGAPMPMPGAGAPMPMPGAGAPGRQPELPRATAPVSPPESQRPPANRAARVPPVPPDTGPRVPPLPGAPPSR